MRGALGLASRRHWKRQGRHMRRIVAILDALYLLRAESVADGPGHLLQQMTHLHPLRQTLTLSRACWLLRALCKTRGASRTRSGKE